MLDSKKSLQQHKKKRRGFQEDVELKFWQLKL